jgi:hypothetical protein
LKLKTATSGVAANSVRTEKRLHYKETPKFDADEFALAVVGTLVPPNKKQKT